MNFMKINIGMLTRDGILYFNIKAENNINNE